MSQASGMSNPSRSRTKFAATTISRREAGRFRSDRGERPAPATRGRPRSGDDEVERAAGRLARGVCASTPRSYR